MSNLSKRLSVGVLTLATIVWATGGVLFTPKANVAQAAVTAGTLIKGTSFSAVYYVTQDSAGVMWRQSFPNEKIYFSWFSDFSGVQVISDAELANVNIGSNVRYRPGTRLVKITTDPKVYAVAPNGALRWVPDEATALALYGSNWASQIDDLSDAFFAPPQYSIGAPLTSGGTQLPDGYLAKDSSNTVYLISGGQKRPIANQAAMDANRYWSRYVHTVADATLAAITSGSSITGGEAALTDVSQGGGTTPPSGTMASVGLAADNPAARTIADGTVYNPLLKLSITAPSDGALNLTGLTVTRGGIFANTNVTGVSVWDQDGMRHGAILTTLNSQGRGTLSFTGSPITVPAGQTRSVTVAGSISASAGSGTINFSVTQATDLTFTGAPTVNGTFPLTGAMMSVVDGASSLAAVKVEGSTTVGLSTEPESSTTGNLEVGQTQMEVAQIKFTETGSYEDGLIRQLVFYVEGDINETTDVKNYTVYGPDGLALAGPVSTSVGRYVTINFATPYRVPKGENKTLTVKADATDGANRWFRLQLQNDYDMIVSGGTTGFNVLPVDNATGFHSTSGWQAVSSSSGYFKIKRGALTVAKHSGSLSGHIAAGTTNVKLAMFNLTANGENLELQKLGIAIVRGTANQHLLAGNLVVKDEATGDVYYSGTASSTSAFNVGTSAVYTTQTSLSQYIQLTSGQTRTIGVYADIYTSSASGDTFQLGFGNAYVRRLSSNDYANLATGGTLANQVTIGAGTLTISRSGWGNPTLAPNTANAQLAEFSIGNTAVGSENIRINTISVGFSGTGPEVATDIVGGSLRLYNGTTLLGSYSGTLASTSNSVTISGGLVVNAGQTVNVRVVADINGNPAANETLTPYLAASSITGVGLTSGNSLSSVPSSQVTGQTVLFNTATARFYLSPDSPQSRVITAGAQNAELGRFKVEVRNDSIQLSRITFFASGTGSIGDTNALPSSWAANASATEWFLNFSLWKCSGGTCDSSPLVSGVELTARDSGIVYNANAPWGNASTTNSSTGAIIFSLATPLTINAYTDPVLVVKANIKTAVGASSSLAAIRLKSTSSADMTVMASNGAMLTGAQLLAGNTGYNDPTDPDGSSAVISNYMLFHETAPTLASQSVTGGTSQQPDADDEIYRVRVTNPGQVQMKLDQLTFTVNGSSLTGGTVSGASATDTVTNFRLYAVTDTGSTQHIASDAAGTGPTVMKQLCGAALVAGGATSCNTQTLSTTTVFTVGTNEISSRFTNTYRYIEAGGSRTFVLVASTTGIRASQSGTTYTQTRNLSVKLDGTTGYDSTNGVTVAGSGDRYWGSGPVRYFYTPFGYVESGYFDASDSYDANGDNLLYQ